MYAVGFREYFGQDEIGYEQLDGLRVRIVDNPSSFEGINIGEVGTIILGSNCRERLIDIRPYADNKFSGVVNVYFDEYSDMRNGAKIQRIDGSTITIPKGHHTYVYLSEIATLNTTKNKEIKFIKKGE